jgi:hypothetical protein
MTHLTEKWAPILDHGDLPEISDPYRKAVTAQLLENQEKFLKEQAAVGISSSGLLTEDPTSTVGTDGFQTAASDKGPRAGFDPVMISMIRRAMPNLIAYDICGVQPMSGPTGLIFAMRAMYDGQFGPNEALFDEADPTFSNGEGRPSSGAYTAYLSERTTVKRSAWQSSLSLCARSDSVLEPAWRSVPRRRHRCRRPR